MTINYFKKNLTCFLLLLLAVGLFSPGCGSMQPIPVEKQILMSYEGVGVIFNTAKPALKMLCANDTLSSEDCLKALEGYNRAVDVYKNLGDTAIEAMNTGNNATYNSVIASLLDVYDKQQLYRTGRADILDLLPPIAQLVSLGFNLAGVIEKSGNVSEEDKEAMKAAITKAKDGVTYWKEHTGDGA